MARDASVCSVLPFHAPGSNADPTPTMDRPRRMRELSDLNPSLLDVVVPFRHFGPPRLTLIGHGLALPWLFSSQFSMKSKHDSNNSELQSRRAEIAKS